MADQTMMDVVKILEYLRNRRDEYAEISKRSSPDGWAASAVSAYEDAITKLESALYGHAESSAKWAMHLKELLRG